MNVLLCIGAGVLMSALLAAILCLFCRCSRRFLLEMFLVSLSLGGVLIGTGVYVQKLYGYSVKEQKNEIEAYKVEQMALAAAANGSFDTAQEILSDGLTEGVYSSEYTLAQAKILALKGDFLGAKMLYAKVAYSDESVSESSESVNTSAKQLAQIVEDDKIDVSLLKSADLGEEFECVDKNGKTQTINVQEQIQAAEKNEALKTKIQDSLQKTILSDGKDSGEGKNIAVLSDIISEVNLIYQALSEQNDSYDEYSEDWGEEYVDYQDNYYGESDQDDYYEAYFDGEDQKDIYSDIDYDTEHLEKLLNRLDSIFSKDVSLKSIAQARYARMKLQVLLGEYGKLAQNIDEYTDYKEYMVIANLYNNGYIGEADFPTGYGRDMEQIYDTVIDQVENVYQTYYDSDNNSKKEEVESFLEQLKQAANSPAMGQLLFQLIDYTNEGLSDRAKIYVLLAQMAQTNGNGSGANEYLTKALDTATDCQDESFTKPMKSLINIITNKGNSEDVKNVSYYVDAVLDHSTIVEVEHDMETFDTYFTDYVSKKRLAVHILDIDSSQFDKLKVRFTVDDEIAYSAEEIKSLLTVYDCDCTINDYQIERVDYDSYYTLLCCDTSGSMEGQAIEDLREAVRLFVENQDEKDELALMEFDSAPVKILGFETSEEDLEMEADNIYASGGTNMYDSAIEALDMFPYDSSSLKTIILMSDGEDNDKRTVDEIYEYIGEPALAKNIIIYTIGLGSQVDSEYLTAIAESTGGSYVYVNDSQSLYDFYEKLNNQNKNQYVLTYRAQDTYTKVSRSCRLRLQSDNLAYDMKTYSLGSSEITQEDQLEGKSVDGLQTRLIYKNAGEVTNYLLGSGFAKEDSISVILSGQQTYDLDVDYVNDTKYKVIIPDGVACDVYDVIIRINGKKVTLADELTVVKQGDKKEVEFGQYKFSAYQVTEVPGATLLSGYVVMNDWLKFRGSIMLNGSMKASTIIMEDYSGSYVEYGNDSFWLGRYMAAHDMTMPIMSLGAVKLSNSEADVRSASFPVQIVDTATVTVANLLELDNPEVELYPDCITMDVKRLVAKFEEDSSLFNGWDLGKKEEDSKESLFAFEHSESFTITGKNVGLDVDISASDKDEKNYHAINFGNTPLYLNHKDFSFKLDSKKGLMDIQYKTKIMYLDMDGIGFHIKLVEHDTNPLALSEIGFSLDKDLKFTVSEVPCTASEFRLNVSDIEQGGPSKWTWSGAMDVTAGTVSKCFPDLEDYLGDVYVLKMDDATITGNVSKRNLTVETTFLLFKDWKLGKIKLQLGCISYSNQLLGMDGEDTKGFVAEYSNALSWASPNKKCELSLEGNAEIAVTNRVVGVTEQGSGSLTFHWWFDKEFNASGSAFIGAYKDHENVLNFAVKTREQKKNLLNKEKMVEKDLIWNKNAGLNYSKKTTKLT